MSLDAYLLNNWQLGRIWVALYSTLTNDGRVLRSSFECDVQKDRWEEIKEFGIDLERNPRSYLKKLHTIKSHCNMGGLPTNMQLKTIESLKWLFTYEVHKIGLCTLNISELFFLCWHLFMALALLSSSLVKWQRMMHLRQSGLWMRFSWIASGRQTCMIRFGKRLQCTCK